MEKGIGWRLWGWILQAALQKKYGKSAEEIDSIYQRKRERDVNATAFSASIYGNMGDVEWAASIAMDRDMKEKRGIILFLLSFSDGLEKRMK